MTVECDDSDTSINTMCLSSSSSALAFFLSNRTKPPITFLSSYLFDSHKASMGVVTYSQEVTSVVAPLRIFKALVLESHNILPMIIPEGIKSVEFIEGHGGVGSIKKTNYGETAHIKYTKHKINALDVDNYYCKYTLVESDIKFDKIDFIVEEVKFSAADNGCVCKMTSEYHVKEGAELKEEDIKKGKDKAMGLFKAVEEYLLVNPNVCA